MTANGFELTALDESYSHQLVAPRSRTAHVHPNWQERCYHLLFAGDDLILDMGRAVWPHGGVRRAFLGISDGATERCVRTELPFDRSDDPDDPSVGGLVVEPIVPLERVRLRSTDSHPDIALDLTYTARFAPVATTPLRVEQEGVVVTDYMNYFQSGVYDGWVEIGGVRRDVVDRAGFRDRGWGMRKHEGAPRRGLVLSVFCELPDAALYLILFETATGRRVLSDGWLMEADRVTSATAVEHELSFEDDLLRGGELLVDLADRRRLEVGVDPRVRLFLSGVGYSADPARRAPGHDTFDLRDPLVVDALRGQTDHGCLFTLNGTPGHGYVETGLGVHARYRPEVRT